MTREIDAEDAAVRIEELVDRTAAGEHVVTRDGRPVARLVPLPRPATPRVSGTMRGTIWIAPDFDEPDEDLIDLMENGPLTCDPTAGC